MMTLAKRMIKSLLIKRVEKHFDISHQYTMQNAENCELYGCHETKTLGFAQREWLSDYHAAMGRLYLSLAQSI